MIAIFSPSTERYHQCCCIIITRIVKCLISQKFGRFRRFLTTFHRIDNLSIIHHIANTVCGKNKKCIASMFDLWFDFRISKWKKKFNNWIFKIILDWNKNCWVCIFENSSFCLGDFSVKSFKIKNFNLEFHSLISNPKSKSYQMFHNHSKLEAS